MYLRPLPISSMQYLTYSGYTFRENLPKRLNYDRKQNREDDYANEVGCFFLFNLPYNICNTFSDKFGIDCEKIGINASLIIQI